MSSGGGQPRSGRRRYLTIGAAAIAIGAAAWWSLWPGGGAATAPRGGAKGFNVLLVTLDTLRADHLGCYGYREIETPVIDALAAEGARFTQAASAVPMTLPSHATIMTGLNPPHHGVRDNGTFRLTPEYETLAEIFQRHGYATAAFIAAFVLDARYGLSQGFDHYDDNLTLEYRPSTAQMTSYPDRPANVVVDAALEWLGTYARPQQSRPFFAWVHLFDAHFPYMPPEPFGSRYADRLYDGEIAFLDAQLGRLLEALRPLGFYDSTLVVLVGDHGESLGEHGEVSHAHLIYESTMRVPLVFWCPGVIAPGAVIDQFVAGAVDVAPTVLELAGLPPVKRCDGRRLFAGGLGPRRAVYMETLSPQLNNGWAPLFGIRRLNDKYIEAPTPEYYDLLADPGELHNQLARRQAQANELADMLAAMMGPGLDESGNASVTPTREEIERLAALGYITGSADDTAAQMDLDPKVMIHGFEERVRGLHLLNQGRPHEAIAVFQAMLARSPNAPVLWALLSAGQMRIGQTDEAIRSARRAVELKPTDPVRWCSLARCYLVIDDQEQADECLAQAERLDPGNGEAVLIRARRALDQDRLEDALDWCRRAIERDPSRSAAAGHALSGMTYARRGDRRAARSAFDAALDNDPKNGGALLGLARLLREAGEPQQAIDLLKRLIEGQEEFREGVRLLGRLHLEIGQVDVAESVLRKVVQMWPSDGAGHYELSRVLAWRGQVDAALDQLERAASFGPLDFEALRADPSFTAMVDNPRFVALERAHAVDR